MKAYDVIIVGAGPAGLLCAKILGQSDLKVLLLEKDKKIYLSLKRRRWKEPSTTSNTCFPRRR